MVAVVPDVCWLRFSCQRNSQLIQNKKIPKHFVSGFLLKNNNLIRKYNVCYLVRFLISLSALSISLIF